MILYQGILALRAASQPSRQTVECSDSSSTCQNFGQYAAELIPKVSKYTVRATSPGEPKCLRRQRTWDKLHGAIRQARKYDYAYICIDACYIDEFSSAELSESINSMCAWYWQAQICYVYL
jgi:hypothetical protein